MMFWFPLILKHWQHWAITDNDESFGHWTKQQFHFISFESFIDVSRGGCDRNDNVIGNILVKLPNEKDLELRGSY
jgi:hypothetical protein